MYCNSILKYNFRQPMHGIINCSVLDIDFLFTVNIEGRVMVAATRRHAAKGWDRLAVPDPEDAEDGTANRTVLNGYAGLGALCLLSIAALLVLVITGMRFNGVTVWEAYVMPPRSTVAATASARFGGLDFGMPASRATTVLPELALTPVASGEVAGIFEWKGVRHSVTFLGGEFGRKAYRFHSVRLMERAAGARLIESLVAEYGRPIEGTCGKPVYTATRYCRHAWIAEGGIGVELTTRPATGADGIERSELTLTYVDLYLDGLKRRSGHAGS